MWSACLPALVYKGMLSSVLLRYYLLDLVNPYFYQRPGFGAFAFFDQYLSDLESRAAVSA